MIPMRNLSKAEALTKVRESRASFDEVVVRATAAGAPVPAELIESVRERFAALEEEGVELDEKVRHGDPRLYALIHRAQEIERLRAYVIPQEELLIEGMSSLSDMNSWSVPPTVLDQLGREVIPQLRSMNFSEARGALRSLYETYDYWDGWIEDHARSMRIASRLMLGLLVVFVTLGVLLLHGGHVYSGIFCAGTSGALLSVLAKLPPVLSYGAANAYYGRIMSRVGVGIAASMIGMGLLAADLISLQMPDHLTIAKMLEGQDRLCMTSGAAPSPASDASTPAAGAPDAGTTAAAASACAPDDHRLSRRAVLLLLALAMLFGFSERALSTFEDKIFPPQSTMVVHTTTGLPQERNRSHAKAPSLPEEEEEEEAPPPPGGADEAPPGGADDKQAEDRKA